jgi:hypothetical protein
MGIGRLWGCFGINAGMNSNHGVSRIDIQNKKVAYELAGNARANVLSACKDVHHARDLSDHIHKKTSLNDRSIVMLVVKGIVDDIAAIMDCGCEHLYVVWEGTWGAKVFEKNRRVEASAKKRENSDWKGSLSVPDCVINIVIEKCKTLYPKRVTFVIPPGEGEAEVMMMLKERLVTHAVITSADSDVMIYDVGNDNAGQVILRHRVKGKRGDAFKYDGLAGCRLEGKVVNAGSAWKKFKVGDTTHDFSGLTMAERALLGAWVGHDYDPDGTGTQNKKAKGIHNVGMKKAVAMMNHGLKEWNDQGRPTPLSTRWEFINECVSGEHKDMVRMAHVVFGFLLHPVKSRPGTGATTFCDYDMSQVSSTLNKVFEINSHLKAQLQKLNDWVVPETSTRCGCDGCKDIITDCRRHAMLYREIVTDYAPFPSRDLKCENQPLLYSDNILNVCSSFTYPFIEVCVLAS